MTTVESPSKTAAEVAFEVVDRFGWFVFPIKKDHKAPPLVKNGLNDASNDPAQVARWVQEFPDCNWAVATGLESGCAVVDIDSQEAENWYDSQWFPEGEVIVTPSGGKHVYFSLVDETEYKSTRSEIYHGLDTRIEGGYALLPGSHTIELIDPNGKYLQHEGIYEGDLSVIPDLPERVADILPLRYFRTGGDEKVYLDTSGKPKEASPGEERVLQQIAQQLENLPRPWSRGAGYHDVMFRMACWLWEIVHSPEYALTERQAEEFYHEHSPTTNPVTKAQERWESAREKTDGRVAEPPGDVPPLLDPQEILDPEKHPEIDRLFWELEKRKDLDILLRECRRSGLNEQQAYSLASASKANTFKDGSRAAPQWGRTKRIYSEVITDEQLDALESEDEGPEIGDERRKAEARSLRGVFLTLEERNIVDRVPNFIDLYVEVAKEIYTAPNLPLVYINAWMVLSSMIGERGYLPELSGPRPLNLYVMPVADSGAGKGEARKQQETVLSCYREGLGSLRPFGRKPTAEAMEKSLIERNGRAALLAVDEAGEIIRAFHNPKGSYMAGVLDMILETYDGSVTRSARVGTTDDERGETVDAHLNVWLQGTWEGITGELTEDDIKTGLIGRFIPAIGWGGNFTQESLRIRWADEYQIAYGGRNPMMTGLGDELNAVLSDMPPGAKIAIKPANEEVDDRIQKFRFDAHQHVQRNPMRKELEPIMARLTLNVVKAAALIALSNGRPTMEMSDVLIAIKSGEYWLGDMQLFAKTVVSGELRKKVVALVEFVEVRSRSEAEILRAKRFENLSQGEIKMLLDRAEAEGHIERGKGNRWEKRERKGTK